MPKGIKGFQKGHLIFKGKKHTEETKKKMMLMAVGRKHTDATKEKLRQYRLGKKHTEKTKKKMSLLRRGEFNSFYGKKHSLETRRKLSSYREKQRVNWKSGITPLHKKVRATWEYKLWKKAVKERDNYECIWCGSNKNIEADHIKPFALFPELRFVIDNGRTLCLDCHKKTDSYGKVEKV